MPQQVTNADMQEIAAALGVEITWMDTDGEPTPWVDTEGLRILAENAPDQAAGRRFLDWLDQRERDSRADPSAS
uniref:Uncharacterized protein n=1 Tax=Streptomyces sp. NBC_00049 TaxID=2903617 RepID=A0AAU2JIU4_9ACTN